MYKYLKSLSIFNGVSELTMYKMSFEFMEQINFKLNETIFNSGEFLEQIQYIKVVKKQDKKDDKNKKFSSPNK